MSTRRRSFGRVLLLAALVLVALVLLELERFLPGSWPGGGGNEGSRSFPTGSQPDPSRVVPSTGAVPPPVPSAERGVLHVVVRRADGTAVPDGKVRIGFAGAGARATADVEAGSARVSLGDRTPVESAYVGADGAEITHGIGPPGAGTDWVVVLPGHAVERADAPAPAETMGSPTILVVDPDGRPIPGATVTRTSRGGETTRTTDAAGRARIDGATEVARYCVAAPGFGETCRYARVGSVGAAQTFRVELSPVRRRTTTFQDPSTGGALAARALRLIDAGGGVRTLEREQGKLERFDADMPDDVAAATALEIDVEGRPPVRVPVLGLAPATPVPAGAAHVFALTDAGGTPIEGATVVARFPIETSSERSSGRRIEARAVTDAFGRATLALPLDRASELVFDAARFAAEGLHLPPTDSAASSAEHAVTLTQGIDVRVIVRDEKGAGVAGADVIVLFAADRSTARRVATTDGNGAATLYAIRPGRVEVLAHRAGFAWAGSTPTVAVGSEPVVLVARPGRRLLLVVEDERGVPLPGVSVRSVPRIDAGNAAPDATDPDAVPWTTDAHGVLAVDDLPDRELDLYLAGEGYTEEVVTRVRPGPTTWFATLVRKVPSPGK